jgi:hypothetical protein
MSNDEEEGDVAMNEEAREARIQSVEDNKP